MLAKITTDGLLTLPKAVNQAVGLSGYVDVEVLNGRIVLTPVRVQRGDALRAELAELNLDEADVGAAVAWARRRCARSAAHTSENRPGVEAGLGDEPALRASARAAR